MGEAKLNVYCRFCEDTHRPRYLCNPAKRILEALLERGMSFNLPTIEFPEPLSGVEQQLGLNPGDKLLVQFVVKAALIPFAGIVKPGLIFTGRTPAGEVVPQWLYAGGDEDLRGLAKLVADITEMAIGRAAEINKPTS